MAHKAYELIKRPIVTEKTAVMAEETSQYVFEVERSASKPELKAAFEQLFEGRKVTSIKTAVIGPRQKRVGARVGTILKRKKAVFTIEGDPIELFAGA